MPNFTQIIKEALTFIGKKFDSIAEKINIDSLSADIKNTTDILGKKLDKIDINAIGEEIKESSELLGKNLGEKINGLKIEEPIKVEMSGIEILTLKGEKGDVGHSPTDEELLNLIEPLIPKAEDGKTPTKEELLKLIRPLIPKVKDGETPSDERLLKLIVPLIPKLKIPKDGKPGKPGKDGSPDTGEQIIEKINENKNKLISKDKIEGYKDIEGLAKTAEANSRLGLRAAGDTVYCADLSSQTDGATKVFTIPVFRRAQMVVMSDFPHFLMVNNGFTAAGTTLTLTVENAPAEGSQLGFLYII